MSQFNARLAQRFHKHADKWRMWMSDTNGAPRTYLIVMQQVLVAQDIALTISDHDPGANVIIASTHAEAEAALVTVADLVLAFVADAPWQFMASSLGQAIMARGGRVVLLGEAAEEAGPTAQWGVLDQPFTTDAVLKHLA
jgi:hypothetical protein